MEKLHQDHWQSEKRCWGRKMWRRASLHLALLVCDTIVGPMQDSKPDCSHEAIASSAAMMFQRSGTHAGRRPWEGRHTTCRLIGPACVSGRSWNRRQRSRFQVKGVKVEKGVAIASRTCNGASDMSLNHSVGNDSIGLSLVEDLAIWSSMIDDRLPCYWLGGVLSGSQIRHAIRRKSASMLVFT